MSHPVHPCASFPDMSGAPWQSHEQADFSALAAGRLPGSSYAGRDWQSDVEVARLLNPAFIMTASWDSIGVHLFQFLTALVTGGSLSSKLWNNDSPTLLWNSFFGYYWILLCVADAMVKATNKWHEHFFQRRRRRTCCKCALKHACVVCVGHLAFLLWFARSKKNAQNCTLPKSRPPLQVYPVFEMEFCQLTTIIWPWQLPKKRRHQLNTQLPPSCRTSKPVTFPRTP